MGVIGKLSLDAKCLTDRSDSGDRGRQGNGRLANPPLRRLNWKRKNPR